MPERKPGLGPLAGCEPARCRGEQRVADDLGVLDRRLTTLDPTPQMNGSEQPAHDLSKAEEGSMLSGIARRACGLDTTRRGERTQAAPEVQPYVGLGLGSPPKGARPPVRVEQQRQGEYGAEDGRDGGG